MIYLAKLRNDRFYRNKKIMSINKKKEIYKHDCIISLGNSQSDLIELINSKVFSQNHYKSVYTPKIVTNNVNSKRTYVNLQNYYKKIRNTTDINLIYKKSLNEYKKRNLYYDASSEINSFFVYEKRKGVARLNDFSSTVNTILNKVSNQYESICLYVPINTNGMTLNGSYFSISSLNKDILQYFYQILRLQSQFDEFKNLISGNNVTIMFHDTNTGLLMKMDMTAELNRLKCFTLFKTLLKASNGAIGLNSEEATLVKEIHKPTPEIEDESLESKKIDKADEVVESVKKALDLNVRKLTTKEIVLIDKIAQTTTEIIDEENISDNKSILDQLEDNEDFKKHLSDLKDIQKVGNSNQQKISELSDKQDNLGISGITIKNILNDYSESKIDNKIISQPNTIFENVKHCTLKDFDDSYVEKESKKDLLKVISSFSKDEDVKMFVDDIKEEVTSTDLTKKKTLSITFKDEKKVKHTVHVDMPILKDGKFMYVNGSRKLIQKQIMLKPIVKLKPDEVQVITNYNKFIIRRFGRKLSDVVEVYKKFLLDEKFSEYLKDNSKLKFKLGNCVIVNNTFNNNIIYNYYSSFLLSMENEEKVVMFNYADIENLINTDNNIKYDKTLSGFEYNAKKYQMMGYYKDKKTILLIEKSSGLIFSFNKKDYTLISDNLNKYIGGMIETEINDYGKSQINSLTRPKTLTYTRVLINNKEIPMIAVLGYEKGLTNILERYDVKYVFTKTNKKPNILSDSVTKVKFADGYLYYDSSKLRNTLLLSGLSAIHTETYNIADFDGLEPYIEYFNDAFGSRNTGKGIHNTLSLMVDPITLDVLEKLELPTNIVDILLYSNTLLEDNTYSNENDMNNYRIRGAEQVNAMLYKLLADSFRSYKDTMKNGNPKKVSLPPDILLKKIVELPTVDEHSTLNPSLEIEKYASATYKGISGKNLDNAYTPDIRTYDDSMVGVFGYSSPDSD